MCACEKENYREDERKKAEKINKIDRKKNNEKLPLSSKPKKSEQIRPLLLFERNGILMRWLFV